MRKTLSKKERFRILQRDGFRCRYCGRSAPYVELQVDHILPVARGGDNNADNLVTACFECNSGKSDRMIGLPIMIHLDPMTYKEIEAEAAENENFNTVEDYVSEMICVEYFLKRGNDGKGVHKTI